MYVCPPRRVAGVAIRRGEPLACVLLLHRTRKKTERPGRTLRAGAFVPYNAERPAARVSDGAIRDYMRLCDGVRSEDEQHDQSDDQQQHARGDPLDVRAVRGAREAQDAEDDEEDGEVP